MCTGLPDVAVRVGSNRVFRTEGNFHKPFGSPEKSPEDEINWRRQELKKALDSLSISVDKPTVFA